MQQQSANINEPLLCQYQQDELGELGWIAAAITAVAALVPFLVKALKRDEWSKMKRADKEQFIIDGLIVAKEAVKTGQAQNIEQAMQHLISQVEKNESWSTWKNRNSWAVAMIEDAQLEVEASKLHQAGILSGNVLGWGLLFSTIGLMWFKRDWISEKTGLKRIMV